MTDTYYQHELPDNGGTFYAPDPAYAGQQPMQVAQNEQVAPPQSQPQQPQAAPQPQQPPQQQEVWSDVPEGEQWTNVPTERDINRTRGAPFPIRVEMARAQNPDEARLVMEHYYGKGNYGQDRSGGWWGMHNDEPTAVYPSGVMPQINPSLAIPGVGPLLSSPAGQNALAHVAASATPIAGGTLGGALGAPAGPFGVAAGTGLGAAAGYGLDQLIKWYRGLYAQKPQEVTKNIAGEAALNMGMTGAIPAAKAVGRPIAQAFRDWVGVTPQSARMTENLVNEGARPPIRSTAPEFKSWGDKQILRDVVAGDPWEASNTEYIRGRLQQALRSSGMPEGEIDSLMAGATNPTAAPTSRPAGEMVVRRAQEHVGNLQAEGLAARQAAERHLRDHEGTLRQWASGPGRNMDTLSEDVAQTLINHRTAFGNQMGREYRAIDAMNGNEKIFDLEPSWRRAREVIDWANPDHVPEYLHRMMRRYDDVLRARTSLTRAQDDLRAARAATPNTPEEAAEQQAKIANLEQQIVDLRIRANGNMTTFHEGHEIRSNIREIMGHDYNPTREPWVQKLSTVEDQIDNTFRAMEGSGGLPGRAAQRLRAADEQYARGIAVFKDTQVRRLISDIRSGVGVDPEAVAASILQMGHTASGRRLLNMLPPELRENVARADMRNIIEEASRRNATSGARELDGMAFMDAIEARKRANLMGDLHSPQALNALRDLGRQLAVLDGRISVDALPPGGVSDAIRTTINNVRQIDAFVKGNPVGAMVQGTPQQVDRAARILSLPGNEAQTIDAARFLGVDSPEWQAVQNRALQGVVRTALIETPKGRWTVSGPDIERLLKKYTPEQQELLFPNGLADDLREVAKQAKFLFPGDPSDFAQSQAAKSITLHTGVNILNPRTAYADTRYLYTTMMGWLTDRPQVLRFLADAARKNPSEARAMLGFIGRSAINAQQMGPGRGRPSPQGEE